MVYTDLSELCGRVISEQTELTMNRLVKTVKNQVKKGLVKEQRTKLQKAGRALPVHMMSLQQGGGLVQKKVYKKVKIIF